MKDHCDIWVLVNEIPDVAHLRIEVRCPYLPYSSHGQRICGIAGVGVKKCVEAVVDRWRLGQRAARQTPPGLLLMSAIPNLDRARVERALISKW